MSDFLDMLKEHNIDLEKLNIYIESEEFELEAGPVVDYNNKNYEIKESDIEGMGVFAAVHFSKGERIGYGVIGKTRTLAGRYGNHSATPNAKYYYFRDNDNMILVADKTIKKGEEIVTNYRQHTYRKEYYE